MELCVILKLNIWLIQRNVKSHLIICLLIKALIGNLSLSFLLFVCHAYTQKHKSLGLNIQSGIMTILENTSHTNYNISPFRQVFLLFIHIFIKPHHHHSDAVNNITRNFRIFLRRGMGGRGLAHTSPDAILFWRENVSCSDAILFRRENCFPALAVVFTCGRGRRRPAWREWCWRKVCGRGEGANKPSSAPGPLWGTTRGR